MARFEPRLYRFEFNQSIIELTRHLYRSHSLSFGRGRASYFTLHSKFSYFFRAMIPHVRNESRAGLGVPDLTCGNGGSGRNCGAVTEMSATVEYLEGRRYPGVDSSPVDDEDDTGPLGDNIPMVEFRKQS